MNNVLHDTVSLHLICLLFFRERIDLLWIPLCLLWALPKSLLVQKTRFDSPECMQSTAFVRAFGWSTLCTTRRHTDHPHNTYNATRRRELTRCTFVNPSSILHIWVPLRSTDTSMSSYHSVCKYLKACKYRRGRYSCIRIK
jgi:hypothetical protein